jgi:hypothetical protein
MVTAETSIPSPCSISKKVLILLSYHYHKERYTSDLNMARQYAGQKVWPRAIYVRRARFDHFLILEISHHSSATRFYHSARLRWNSIERLRSGQDDSLIDDLVEWSMWHYAISGLQILHLTKVLADTCL